jgi:hypothetical protein
MTFPNCILETKFVYGIGTVGGITCSATDALGTSGSNYGTVIGWTRNATETQGAPCGGCLA